ncbi:MAG: NADPH:quinone oxidoreductase family protein [Mycobacterium sp.]
MKAFRLHSYDGPTALTLDDVPDLPREGEVAIVDVKAIGVNFPDLLLTKGQYQRKPETPFTPGCEVAGVISWAPADSIWDVGDRVMAFVWDGSYAESVAVPLHALVAIPDDMGFDVAAGLVVNHHTVHFALARRGHLQAGESVLVMGAAGGIGSAAVQVAKGLQARVIAGVAGEHEVGVAEAAGADEVIVLEKGFSARVRELTGGDGVDVILDPLGDWLFDEGVRALASEGRILVIGFAAGDIPSLRTNRLLLRNVSAVGVAWGATLDKDPALLSWGAEALHRMYAEGSVNPQIGHRFSFEEIPSALQRLEAHEIRGKAIIEMP